jgi:HSP20 family molecular chaperone IbpA
MFSRSLEKVMSDLFDEFTPMTSTTLKQPNVNLKDSILTLNWDLPGASKDHIELDTENDIIIVRGIEGRYKNLQSKIRISKDYNLNKSEASLKDGVLTVTIPKEINESRNKIKIK